MNKILVKSKIVLEDDGKSLVIYFWKRSFLCFGYWYPFGSSCANFKIEKEAISFINDKTVSNLLNTHFLRKYLKKNKIKL